MSSQFSYELDERQIRISMQDAELNYNDSLWNKFDELSVTQSKISAGVSNFMPKINFSISRSIIVPVIFIVLIGGLSAMLFSFVDFKKKEFIEKEIPYVAKAERTEQPEIKTKTAISPKTIVTKTISTVAAIDTNYGITTSNSVAIEPLVAKKDESIKAIESKSPEIIGSSTELKKEPVVMQKKKSRKVKTEVLPTINASTTTNLNEGVAEPELELK